MQLEGLSIERPHVLDQQHALQVVLQRLQLEVRTAVIVGKNGDAVVQLSRVGVGCVVDQHHAVHVAVDHS